MPDTLGDLKQRVIDETIRDDLTDELKDALQTCIQKSIDHYEWERWWFNESIATINCVPGSQYVAIDPTVLRIDVIRAVIGGVRYKMTERPLDWILSAYSTPVAGQPTEWATYVDQIVIYPNPNQAYPLLCEQVVQVQPPLDYTDDSSGNRWTNEGADLIVSRTKIRLYRDYLSATAQDQRVMNATVQEQEAYTKLRSQSNRRMSVDQVTAGW
jgi:hypothetical protein